MGTAAGVEIGTRAATALVDGPTPPTLLASGVRDVAVKRDTDGTLAASGVVGAVAAGFAGQLGQPEPIMVAGTPSSVEALLAVVIGAGLADVGGAPLVALAHADGLDEHRRSLLLASARLAGIPDGAVELVGAAEARAALAGSGLSVAADLAVATGAALVALQRRAVAAAGASAGGLGPAAAGAAAGAGAAATGAAAGAGVAAVAGAGGAGAAGAVGPAGVVPHLGAGAAAAPAAPAGVVPHLGAGATAAPAAPAGVVPHLGAAGTPLTGAPAAPAGTVPHLGAGTPLTGSPAGPAGTVPHLGAGAESAAGLNAEMTAAGAGPPVAPAGTVPHLGAGAAGVTGLKLGILAAVMVAIVAVAGIGYALTRGGDDEIRSAPPATDETARPTATDSGGQSPPTTAVAVAATSVITEAPATTDAPVATEASTTVDTTIPAGECIVGTWVMDNDAYAALATAAVAVAGGVVGVTSGQIVVNVQPDGTYQVNPEGFSVALTLPEGAANMVWSGGDSGVWSVNADGTFTIQPTAVGTTIAIDVTIDGGSFSIPVPSDGGTLQGSHVSECSGDLLKLITNTGDIDHVPLIRS